MSVRNMNATLETSSHAVNEAGFVAINFITCQDDYCSRFEELFSTRAKAIDTMPGFKDMQVLRPNKPGQPYLVVSHWSSEEEFKAWVGSEEFIEGHRRGFEDLRQANQRGEEPPMTSSFVTYDVIAR